MWTEDKKWIAVGLSQSLCELKTKKWTVVGLSLSFSVSRRLRNGRSKLETDRFYDMY